MVSSCSFRTWITDLTEFGRLEKQFLEHIAKLDEDAKVSFIFLSFLFWRKASQR